jgi:hypothetical protein
VAPLKEKGKLVSHSKEKAQILIKHFSSVFTRGSLDNMPETHINLKSTIPSIKIKTEGEEKLLRNINPYKASGPDNIPNWILKQCAKQLAPSLAIIFQSSIDTGVLPKYISTIYKKGDKHWAENYRPVSFTSVPSKLLEHIICRNMMNHLEKHNILTPLNHGFRSGHSCETQLTVTIHDMIQSFDRKKQLDIAILDFFKAFDTGPHDRLLRKLNNYGIRGPLHAWLTTFLTKRKMRVALEGEFSNEATVESRVPQVTVLEPILFIYHINDLPNAVSYKVRLFTDDCLLHREINNENDQKTLQKDLQDLEKWATNWGMRFNAKKCYMLSLRKKIQGSYKLDGHTLEQVPSNPYSGVQIQEDLKWKEHINNVTKKASSTLGFLRRNLQHCSRECRKTAYIALVRSIMEYGAIIWDPYNKNDINKLENLQCPFHY